MRALGTACLVIAVAASICCAMDPDNIDAFTQDLTAALANMGMNPADLRIRHDYAKPDAFRLPLVDSLMYDPATLLYRMDNLAGEIEAESLLAEIEFLLWKAMSVEPDCGRVRAAGRIRIRDHVGSFAHLPVQVRQAVSAYHGRIAVACVLRDKAIADVRQDLGFLCANYPSLVTPSHEYEQVGPFELYEIERREQALTDSVLRLSESIDVRALASMAYVAAQAGEDLHDDMEHLPPIPARYERFRGGAVSFLDHRSRVTGKIMYLGQTEHGPVVIGGSGRNTYSGCFALILDVGGDDIYDLTHQPEVSFRLIIDHEGDDTYRSGDSSAVAGAIFGTSILIDCSGNDTYRAPSISLGAAICGTGILIDEHGDDSYISGGFSQGAGFLGVGILQDAAGNDTYVAEMQSQAFGYVMGSGLLFDQGGNDTYYTSMAHTDILRYDDHYLTLSQGCAFGSRPDYSGGIGLLLDSDGNDLYSSDIFGQGVAYWFAVGALIDRGGHDRYCSYQYAQGAGIHLAFGLLVDESGDDFYQSKGVSHGCGHDLSLGLLADFSGNDCFTAADLSQGAGNANGTGILYDADGNDSYSSKSTVNVNGYGDYRREFGSIGLHIDRQGRDFYSARGDNESIWESGKYGFAMDIPGEATKPRGDLRVDKYPFEAGEFTQRELFILTTRGEPRFADWRQYAFDKMVEDSLPTIAYLRTVLDTKDARERHTIKDILRKIGEPSVPMLSEAVREDNERAQAEASWILGLIGSPRGFDALLELSYAESWKLRSSGLNALGKLEDLTLNDKDRLAARIAQVLRDPDEVFYVKKDAAFAAGNQGICGLLTLLLDSLGDDHYSVRFSVCEAIDDLSEVSCADVADSLTARMPELGSCALVAAIYAARGFPLDQRLDIAEAGLSLPQSEQPEIALALAGLITTVEPETEAQKQRLDSISEKIPHQFWGVGAVLGSQ